MFVCLEPVGCITTVLLLLSRALWEYSYLDGAELLPGVVQLSSQVVDLSGELLHLFSCRCCIPDCSTTKQMGTMRGIFNGDNLARVLACWP
jgi:hypothetical protein